MSTALVKQENGLAPQDFFTVEQRKMIRDTFLGGASDPEAAVLLEVARSRRLNPITRQIHFLRRNQWDDDTKSYVTKWSCQTSIDGFRAIAERTGRYDGQDEPEFEYDDKGKLRLARVRVYKAGIARPFVGIAHFSEYAQTKKDGTPTKMWAEKPHVMLAKCAEALGLRKAFPDDMAGLYTEDELPHPEPKAAPPPAVSHKVDDDGAVFDGVTGEVISVKRGADETLESDLRASVKNGTAGRQREPVEAGGTPAPPTTGNGGAPEQPASPSPGEPPGVVANRLLLAIAAGFDNEIHWANWKTKHQAEIDKLPANMQKAVNKAYDHADHKAA